MKEKVVNTRNVMLLKLLKMKEKLVAKVQFLI